MAKKAKWLEESTTGELLDIIKEGFNSEDDKANTKAEKALDELMERTPDSDGQVTVEDALVELTAAVDKVGAAYKAELDAMADDPDADEEEAPKGKGRGKDKEESDDEESDDEDLSGKSKKELVKIAKELGVPSARKKSTEELVKLIKEAQNEAGDDEEEVDYDEMSKAELLAEVKDRGLKANKKSSKEDLIAILEEDDEDEE